MTGQPFDPDISTDREAFLDRVVEKLGRHPCDFQGVFRQLITSRNMDNRRLAAGVLLPLLFHKSSPGSPSSGSFLFQLIKRSSNVSQPGDLSFPGGMLHPVVDRLLRLLLISSPSRIFRGNARKYASQQEGDVFRLITLFLANTLRESWEEIRLSPFRVHFLGPLPTYSLTLFGRTIFPVAGFVENPGLLFPNREVEKIVTIPLSSFYQRDLFGCYQIDAVDPDGHHLLQYRPCLIHCDPDGSQEILWGATFCIIVKFLEIVLNFRLPDWRSGRVIVRNQHPDYLTALRPFVDLIQ